MNPSQQMFIDGFKAWNINTMARAVIALSEEFAQHPLSEASKQEVTWNCREFLAQVEMYPLLTFIIYVEEIKTSFAVKISPQPLSLDTGKGYDSIEFRFDLVTSWWEAHKERWEQMEVRETQLLIDRAEVHTPGPLLGEAGFETYRETRVSLHRPAQSTPLAPTHTYAHALSVEAEESPLLRRYCAGECKQVWEELTALGERVRDPQVLPHAIAVVRETMRRCRSNVAYLHGRLQARHYRFESAQTALEPPAKNVLEMIARLEARVGPLPLSLCAWYEIVGAVDFMHADLNDFDTLVEAEDEQAGEEDSYYEYCDPLVVFPAAEALAYSEDNWERERYRIILAPDYYHKDHTSGGAAYSVYLPDAAADTLFVHEPHETTFMDYLRRAFLHGGFTFPVLGENAVSQELSEAEAESIQPV